MFEVCHYLMVFSATSKIDTQWLRLFRILQTTKQKLSPFIVDLQCELFGTDPTSIIKQNLPGQFIPSLAFYLPEPDFATLFPKLTSSQVIGKIRIYKANMEKQLQKLLRRCQILISRKEMQNAHGKQKERITVVGTHLDTLFSTQVSRSIIVLPRNAPNP
eukprot:UN30866